MIPYIVRQGDYLDRIAHAAGVPASTIWEDPQNRRLRELRGDGSMLAPFDIVYVPEPKRVFHPVTVGTTTRFVATVPTVKLQVVLEDEDGPIANEPFVVVELPGEGDTQQSGADGLVAIEVPITTPSVTIKLTKQNALIPLLIGHLDPASESSGVEHRLANLGYRSTADIFAKLGAPAADVAAPIRQFQRDSHLPETGVCDDATRRALIDRHGC